MEKMNIGFNLNNLNSIPVPTSWGGWNMGFVKVNNHNNFFNRRTMGPGNSLEDLSSICGSDFSSTGSSPVSSPTDSVTSESIEADWLARSKEDVFPSTWEEEEENLAVSYNNSYHHQNNTTSFGNGDDEMETCIETSLNGSIYGDPVDDDDDYKDPSRYYLTARRPRRTGNRLQNGSRNNLTFSSFSGSMSPCQSPWRNQFTTGRTTSNYTNNIKPRSAVCKRDKTGEAKLNEPFDDWGDLPTSDDEFDNGRAAKSCRTFNY